MTTLDTSIYSNLFKVKSPEEYASERQQVEASALANALTRKKTQTFDQEQNFLSTIRAARQRGASADELVNMGDFEGAKERQGFDGAKKKAEWDGEKHQLEMARAKTERLGQIIGSAKDPASYAIARQTAANEGFDVSKVPEAFSPAHVEQLARQNLTSAQQLEQIWKQKGYDLNVRQQDEVERNNRVQNKISQGNLAVAQGGLGLRQQEFKYQQSKDAEERKLKLDVAGLKSGATTGAGGTPKLTESQAKATTFLGQMRSAQKTLTDLGADKAGFWGQLGVAVAGGKGNIIAPAKAQQIKQAQSQWSEGFLRFKTGAAATKDEIERNNATYFPQIGDEADVIEQKRKARLQAERDMEAPAGPGVNTVAAPRNEDRKVVRTGTHNGRKVVQYSDGTTAYAD